MSSANIYKYLRCSGEVQVLHAGQTIYSESGVEHWHGASPNSFMVHLAVWEAPDDDQPETIWGDHVTDSEYNQNA